MSEEITTDARIYFHVEQSKPVITLCVEERQGDRRLYHRDFKIDVDHVLLLKESIHVMDLEVVRDMLESTSGASKTEPV